MKNKLLVFLAVMFLHIAGLSAQNYFVIAPYIQNVSDTAFHVLFETSQSSTPIAFLAEAEDNILKANYKELKLNRRARALHNITFNRLRRGGEYIFRVGALAAGDTLWGQATRFNIPDYQRQPVVFAVIGDTQNSGATWEHFSQMIADEGANFLIHVGDLIQSGSQKRYWNEHFFKSGADLLRSTPVYPVLGNHKENTPWYFQYFDLPHPKWFYTKHIGDALFIFVDTNRDVLPGSKQYKMLEEALRTVGVKWKIVVHHHPVYVSSGYYNPLIQKTITGDPNIVNLRRLYETCGVDVVFNGHIHNYERTMPIYEDAINENLGVTCITTGGGGGDIDNQWKNRTWFMATAKRRHHYLKATIWGNRLLVQAIDSSGLEIDRWDKQKFMPEVAIPYIETFEPYFYDDESYIIVIGADERRNVRYKIDNAPLRTVKGVSVTFPVMRTTTVSAFTSDRNKRLSRKVSRTITKLPLMPAQKLRATSDVQAEYCEGMYTVLPDFDKEKPVNVFTLDSLTLDDIRPRRENHWAVRFTGTFTVPETAVYRLLLRSYDGSLLKIDTKEIIGNDGMHYEIAKEEYVALEKGVHTFEVQYFDYTRRETLQLWMNPIYEDLVDFNTYIKRGN